MLKPPHEQYNERIKTLFQSWLTEQQSKEPAELLARAEDHIEKLNNFAYVAFLSDEEKAVRAEAGDFEIWAPFTGCLDFNPDYVQLRDVVESIAQGAYDREKYPSRPDRFETAGMTVQEMRACLLEKLRKEYGNHVLGAYLEMNQTDILLHAEGYVRLDLFNTELCDWLSGVETDQAGLLQMLNLENTLDTIFSEYEGRSLKDYMELGTFPEFSEFYLPECASAPGLDMCL